MSEKVKCAYCGTAFELDPWQTLFPDGARVMHRGEEAKIYQAPSLCPECCKSSEIVIEVNRRFLHALENPV